MLLHPHKSGSQWTQNAGPPWGVGLPQRSYDTWPSSNRVTL